MMNQSQAINRISQMATELNRALAAVTINQQADMKLREVMRKVQIEVKQYLDEVPHD